MANKDAKTDAVENFEQRRDYMRKESAGSHHDGSEFPSSDDVLDVRGEGEGDRAAVPPKDGDASDAETPAEELHGSLHGRWTATDER
jgi:hypothetical protein